MMIRRIQALAVMLPLALALATSAKAQDDERTEQVHFAAGTTGTSIADSVTGREYVVYEVGTEAGQWMEITLRSDNDATYFNVYAPGSGPGDEALAMGEMTGPLIPEMNHFEGELTASGVYSISVFLYRNAARDGEQSDYTLDISITGDTGEVVKGDYADGLEGGPDFWRVKADGGLKLHSTASAGSSVLITLPNGLEVRNLGCRMAEGRRWCQISTPEPSLTGWAAGDFLVEASGEMATQLPDLVPVQQEPGDALVPGTDFHATGEIVCTRSSDAADAMCKFGVTREADSNGSITIFWPDGGSRVIFYEDFTPMSFDQSEADGGLEMTATKQGEDNIVMIGEERFLIPDIVMTGG